MIGPKRPLASCRISSRKGNSVIIGSCSCSEVNICVRTQAGTPAGVPVFSALAAASKIRSRIVAMFPSVRAQQMGQRTVRLLQALTHYVQRPVHPDLLADRIVRHEGRK